MTVESPLSRLMELTSGSGETSIAEVLSDLNLFYIRQIGASLKKHVGLQDRLEREIKIRDGASRLMAACTHENQLLEAAKTLHTSNARTFAYMAELQKLKAAEVMDALMDDPGFSEESRICKGRIAISNIRIPLVWREVFANSKSKDHGKHAAFCLLTLGSEVQDTELVCIDKSTTDISFNDVIVFENASYDFKLRVEIFAYPMCSSSVSAPTPQKLFSRLNRSIGKSEGKRTRERLNSAPSLKLGPQYEKLGHLTLTLEDVGESMHSHDLERIPQSDTRANLPLYENVTFRLVAQPKCLTERCVTGFLNYLEMIGAVPSWSLIWCEVKAGVLKGWKNPEDSATKPPHVSVDLLRKDVKINEIEKPRQKRSHSFQVRDLTERNLFAAGDREDLIKWIRGLRQHKSDHAAWSAACVIDDVIRKPMFIASPSPRKLPSELIFDRGVRKTLVYEQLGMDSPLKAMTDAIRCTDMLRDENLDPRDMTSSVQAMLLDNQTTAPWAGFFTGVTNKPAKVTKVTNIQSETVGRHGYGLRSASACCHDDGNPSDDSDPKSFKLRHQGAVGSTSGSDDAFLSDSDDNTFRTPPSRKPPHLSNNSKKKRKAPMPPRDKPPRPSTRATPPPKPPLPKLPPKGMTTRSSLSSASSLDDILEERGGCHRNRDSPKPRHQRQMSADHLLYRKTMKRGVADGGEEVDPPASIDSLHKSSQSSGYKSETENSSMSSEPALSVRRNERIWERKENCVMPTAIIPLAKGEDDMKPRNFERSQSLDVEGFKRIQGGMRTKTGGARLLAPPSEQEVIYAEPEECRPRTNTLPSISPSRRARLISTPDPASPLTESSGSYRKPIPTPRKSYLTAVEGNQVDKGKHIYEIPFAKVDEHHTSDKVSYRQLQFDANARVYMQAKPPGLPAKKKQMEKEQVLNKEEQVKEEPVYAKVDKKKKQADRAAKKSKGVDAYTKAHKAIITVCKQRMDEEQKREEKEREEQISSEPIQTYNVVNRELVSRV
uniref:Actin-binding protein anillin-like n=1 Tax=Phallusia mammillata TaxID=59560 RepID=A0A6F9D7B3_9ASCI|nr:actin-binding protein anillin-like [Phallusia mammillata]